MLQRRTAVLAIAATSLLSVGLAEASQSALPTLGVSLDTSTSLVFAYPAEWHALSSTFVTSHYSAVAFVSSQSLHKPCLEAPAPCNPDAIDRLAPGGVYAKWLEVGSFYKSTSQPSGKTTTPVSVGGRSGWMLTEARGSCGGLGPAKTVEVMLPGGHNSGALEFLACLRAPGLAANQGLVEQILHSTRIVSSQPAP